MHGREDHRGREARPSGAEMLTHLMMAGAERPQKGPEQRSAFARHASGEPFPCSKSIRG